VSDIYGTTIKLGDEGRVDGAGSAWKQDSFFRLYQENTWFFINTFFSGSYEMKDTPAETTRMYIPVTAGAEYRYQVMNYPLFVKAAGEMGAFYFNRMGPERIGPFIDPSKTETINTFGPCAGISLGIFAQANRRWAFFADGGYHVARFFDEKLDGIISGIQLRGGFSYALDGGHRELLNY